MNVQLVQQNAIRVAMLRHTGPYETLDKKFEELWRWVESQNVPAGRTIGIYFDNPDQVPSGQLRSAACVEIPDDYLVSSRGGLDLQLDEVAGGTYATTRYVGPYEDLDRVWTQMTQQIETSMGESISEELPAFEVYVNDVSDTPPAQLITELFMPIA